MRDEWKSNNLLSVLRRDDLDLLLLAPSRTPTTASNAVLDDHGQNVETVYFPRKSTLASFVISTSDGTVVETLIVGREGAVVEFSRWRLPAVAYHGSTWRRFPDLARFHS